MIKNRLIIKYEEGRGGVDCWDKIAEEKALTVAVNGDEIITLLCSPDNLSELALGFLLSEGILTWNAETAVEVDEVIGLANVLTSSIKELNLNSLGKRSISTGCGKGAVFYSLNDHRDRNVVNDETRFQLGHLRQTMADLQMHSVSFQETGGVHSAGLIYNGDLILREDVGRHNAVDKLLGYCFLSKFMPESSGLFLSGRISSEIVLKAGRMGFPLIVSRSAPTTLAVDLAEELGITLVGFVRGKRANIYSHQRRIIL